MNLFTVIRDVKLLKRKNHPLQVLEKQYSPVWSGAGGEVYLTVLHPVYEVSADDVGLVGEGVVGTKHLDNILVSNSLSNHYHYQVHFHQTCPEDSFLLRIF